MSFSLGGEVISKSRRVPVEVGGGGFTLLLKAVSEEDRLADSGLATRFWKAEDPAEIKQWMVARTKLRISASVEGWEGVTAPTGANGEEVAVPYSEDALARLLRVPGVSKVVIPVIDDHFVGADDEAALKKLGESLPDSSGGDSSKTSLT